MRKKKGLRISTDPSSLMRKIGFLLSFCGGAFFKLLFFCGKHLTCALDFDKIRRLYVRVCAKRTLTHCHKDSTGNKKAQEQMQHFYQQSRACRTAHQYIPRRRQTGGKGKA